MGPAQHKGQTVSVGGLTSTSSCIFIFSKMSGIVDKFGGLVGIAKIKNKKHFPGLPGTSEDSTI